MSYNKKLKDIMKLINSEGDDYGDKYQYSNDKNEKKDFSGNKKNFNKKIDKALLSNKEYQNIDYNIKINDDNNVQNSLNKNINNDNNDSPEINIFNSFKPKSISNSPQITKNLQEFTYDNEENDFNKNNYDDFSNNKNNFNYTFSETVKTKIEDEKINKDKNEQKLMTLNEKINGNKNFLSLNTFGSKKNDNFDNNSKDSEDTEKQREEEFLRKEDLKVKNYKKQIQKEEENGKENVIDEEDIDDNSKINFNHNKINFKQNQFPGDKQNLNIVYPPTQTNSPKFSDMKAKEESVKLMQNQIIINPNNTQNENGKNIIQNNLINSDRKNIYNKRIYKKVPINQKTGIKDNNKLNSPFDKKINISNNNYEYNVPSVGSFNIYSNRNDLINNKAINQKKYLNKNELNDIKKKLYESGNKQKKTENKKPIIMKKEKEKEKENSNTTTPAKQKRLDTIKEKYSFTPEINKKSRKIWEKRNKKIEEIKKTPEKYNISRSTRNIYDLLNYIGNYQNEKIKQKYKEESDNIKLRANKKKINDNTYQKAEAWTNKIIDNIIKKIIENSGSENFSILNIVQSLCSLGIINELIKMEKIKELNLKFLKNAINNIKMNDQKKIEELDFIEQLWLLMNPSMEETIHYKLFSDLIKILFNSDNSKIKQNSEYIKNLLEKNNINIIQNNNQNIYLTPLREKTFELKDLWSISKLIKCFINIKSSFKAYKNNYYTLKKQELKNKLKEEEDKELSFDPEINRLKYHFRNAKFEDYNSKNDDLNKTFSTSKKNDFNKIYKRFIDEKNSREKALEIMREIKKEKELKKCTSKPSIIEYKPRKTYLANRMNKSVDFSICGTNNNQKKVPIFEKLYSLRKIYDQKKVKNDEGEDMKDKFNTNHSFKEKNNNNINHSKKNIINKKYNKREPKEPAIKNKSEDKKINNNNYNKNNENKVYEKKNMKINKFNICKGEKNNFIDNIYIIMEIKTPNGKSKPIKIFKNQNNLNITVEEFCQNNKINNEDKKLIYNQVLFYKNQIFGRNTFNKYDKYNKTKNGC